MNKYGETCGQRLHLVSHAPFKPTVEIQQRSCFETLFSKLSAAHLSEEHHNTGILAVKMKGTHTSYSHVSPLGLWHRPVWQCELQGHGEVVPCGWNIQKQRLGEGLLMALRLRGCMFMTNMNGMDHQDTIKSVQFDILMINVSLSVKSECMPI